MVRVTAGDASDELEGIAGKTVADVREAFAKLYPGVADASALINDSPPRDGEQTVLEDDDELKFTKTIARKG